MSMVSSSFVVRNKFGMHARPAAMFARRAQRYEANINVKNGSGYVNGKSILELLTIGAKKGTLLTVVADGCDADEAIKNIKGLFSRAFGER